MKNFLINGIILIFAVSNILIAESNYANNQIVLKLKPELNSNIINSFDTSIFTNQNILNLNKKYNFKLLKKIGASSNSNYYCFEFQNNIDIIKAIEEYKSSGLFEFVEPNYIGQGTGSEPVTPNDFYFFRQYGHKNEGTFFLSESKVDADIDLDEAWGIEQGDSSIIVSTLDSGIRLEHPEFEGRIWINPNEINDGIDNDENGLIDDLYGWNYAYDNKQLIDDYGHGTNVTGIIAANGNNKIGYAGVDWECKLMTCKVLDKNNFGYYTWWADAIYYSVVNGAKVINMSLGGAGNSALLHDAVKFAKENDVTIIVSMGNANSSNPYYPAAFPETIAVGATNAKDERVNPFFWDKESGSNFGEHIDVVAPGSYIYGLSNSSDNSYGSYWGGTSQAAPYVSGLASLLLAQDNTRNPDDIRAILRLTADDQVGKSEEDTEGFDIYYGYGRINAYEALKFAGNSIAIENTKIEIYPNPTEKILNINMPYINQNYNIYNSLGQIIQTGKTHKGNFTLYLDNYTSGVYILEIIDLSNNLKSIHKTFIKK